MKNILLITLCAFYLNANSQSFNSLTSAGVVTTSDSTIIHRPGRYYKAAIVNFPFATLSTAQTFTAKKTFTLATTEMTNVSLLDASSSTYKLALDVSALNTLRLAGSTFTDLSTPATTFGFTGAAITLRATTSGVGMSINTTGGSTAHVGVAIGRSTSITSTTGTNNIGLLNATFAPTTGSGVFNGLGTSSVTINQTNGGVAPTGAMSIINIQPTVSSVITNLYGLRSQIAASPTGGGVAWNIYADGTAGNYLAGSLTLGSGGTAISKIISATATLDFANTNPQTESDLTISLTGAALGDVVSIGVPNASVTAGSCFTAWVSSADVVTIRFSVYSAVAKDPASGVFRVCVTKF